MAAGRRGQASAPAELKRGSCEGLTEVVASDNIHLRPETETESLLYLIWKGNITILTEN